MMDRPDSQDIAKGFMIFLAVMAHVVMRQETPVWRVAISAFHVPLFFIVSGIVIGRAKDGWRTYVRKNALVLLLPYLIWSLLYAPFRIESLPWILYGNHAALVRIGANAALWFLPALFCARLMYEAVMQLVEHLSGPRLPAVFLAATAAFAFGWLLPQPAVGYPLGLNVGVVALGFILIGSVIRDCLAAAERQRWFVLASVFLAAAVLFAYGAFLRPGEHVLVGMAEFRFGSRFWFFWNALTGCAAVLSVASLLATLPRNCPVGWLRPVAVWTGRNAIAFFLIHLPVVGLLVRPCLQTLGLNRLSWYGAFVGAAVTMTVCGALILTVTKFVPALFGWLGIRKDAL